MTTELNQGSRLKRSGQLPPPGKLHPQHHKRIAQRPVYQRAEHRIGDARLFGMTFGVDNFNHFANDRFGKGQVDRVAHFDKCAALVGETKDRLIDRCAVFIAAVVADNFGGCAADGVAQKRQIAAQRERQSCCRQGQANRENEGFDRAGLALFFGLVKVIIIKASAGSGEGANRRKTT